jgi:UDP-N-acetylmuramate--alanine ligase
MYSQRHIHLIGIGGVGMSGIAEVLLTLGYQVSGSDLKQSPVLDRLRSLGGEISIGHAASQLGDADCVVVSSAVPVDNPERLAAEERGIPVVPRAEILAELMRTKYAVAVAGAHGKTTTTSLIAQVLTEGGLDPTVVVGGRIRSTGSGARLGAGVYMVAEADESDGSFLRLLPSVAVVTNIDREHMTHFGNEEAIEAAFSSFVDHVPFYGAAILCVDDPKVAALAETTKRRVRTYGLEAGAEFRALDLEMNGLTARFRVEIGGRTVGVAATQMPGRHNVQNSLAAIAVGVEFGLPWPVIRDGLAAFGGVSRRFDVRGEHGGTILVDDYGHHPTEIAAVLATARNAWPRRRIVTIFQPHRYSRTLDLADQFARAFRAADRVIVCPIYAAGEAPIPGVSAAGLAQSIARASEVMVTVAQGIDEAGDLLRREAQAGDVWITLGAGDVVRVADAWSRHVAGAEVG